MRGRPSRTSRPGTPGILASALWLTSLATSVAFADIPPGERAVLEAIYQNTGGADWLGGSDPQQPDGWLGAPGTECSWYGIACDVNKNHVVSIALGNNHLVGGPLPDLTALTNLKSFYVYNNQLTGPIPSLAGLGAFQVFFAYNNQLSGAIPPLSGVGLNGLQSFNVSNNQLSGPIPALNGAHALSAFYADHNHLSGPIPDLGGLGYLTNFDVANNDLSGPMPALSGVGLINLKYIWVDHNHLSGNIPDLGDVTTLRFFYANDNRLNGTIPALDTLFDLQEFRVENNQLTGAPPPPPSPGSLIPGHSSLCPNPLDLVTSFGWNAPTGYTPWYYPCYHIFDDGFEPLP